MFSRMSTSIFHSKFIAKYISDSIGRIILYVFMLLAFISLPSLFYYSKYVHLSSDDHRQIISEIQDLNLNWHFENGIFYSDGEESFSSSGFLFTNAKSKMDSQKINFVFGEKYVTAYYSGSELAVKDYESLNIKDFSFSLNSLQDKSSCVVMLDSLYDITIRPTMILINCLYNLFYNVILYFVFTLMLFWVCGVLNPLIPPKFRIKIAIYASTIVYFFDFIGQLVGGEYVMLIGVVFSVFIARNAVSSIVKIEEKK